MDREVESCALCEDDFHTIAIAAGALPPEGEMTLELLEYIRTIVGQCAAMGDRYTDEDGTAGDEIRQRWGLDRAIHCLSIQQTDMLYHARVRHCPNAPDGEPLQLKDFDMPITGTGAHEPSTMRV